MLLFLGSLPDDLADIQEQKGSMKYAMIFLACLCVLMGLLVIVPDLKAGILDPAVKSLTDGMMYSVKVINM